MPYSNLGWDTDYPDRRSECRNTIILSRVWLTKDAGFALIIWFINNLQVETTINLTLFMIFTLQSTPR
jgi:hypothetical protein